MQDLKQKAKEIRISIIKALAEAGSGHTAGSLGMADIFTAFYFNLLKDEDKLILSNGHIVPVRYSAMAHAGYFPVEEFEKGLRKFGSRFQGHPERTKIKELENTSGPLGCGLGQACGIALGMKMDKKDSFVYCVTSDGEHQEGNIWESAMFASKNKLNNLIQIIDRNQIQISGGTEKVMPLDSLKEKYESFGWEVFEVDGNDIEKFIKIIEEVKKSAFAGSSGETKKEKPFVIIANVIPGKGVKEIEGDYKWHGIAPTKEQAEKFIKEIYGK